MYFYNNPLKYLSPQSPFSSFLLVNTIVFVTIWFVLIECSFCIWQLMHSCFLMNFWVVLSRINKSPHGPCRSEPTFTYNKLYLAPHPHLCLTITIFGLVPKPDLWPNHSASAPVVQDMHQVWGSIKTSRCFSDCQPASLCWVWALWPQITSMKMFPCAETETSQWSALVSNIPVISPWSEHPSSPWQPASPSAGSGFWTGVLSVFVLLWFSTRSHGCGSSKTSKTSKTRSSHGSELVVAAAMVLVHSPTRPWVRPEPLWSWTSVNIGCGSDFSRTSTRCASVTLRPWTRTTSRDR